MRAYQPLLVLLFGIAPSSTAQSAVQVSLGLGRYDHSDELSSPLRYGGLGPSIGVGWRHQGRTLTGVDLQFTPSRLTSSISEADKHYLTAWTGSIALHWLRRIAGRDRSEWYLGSRLDFFTSYRRQHYHSLFPTEIYGDLIGAIDVSASWIWRPAPRHQFRHAVATPVVSAALRTPYTGAKFMPDVLFGGPGRLVGMRYELEYASVGMGSSGWGAMYGLQVFRYPDPRPLLVATHRLAGVLRFGRIIPP